MVQIFQWAWEGVALISIAKQSAMRSSLAILVDWLHQILRSVVAKVPFAAEPIETNLRVLLPVVMKTQFWTQLFKARLI